MNLFAASCPPPLRALVGLIALAGASLAGAQSPVTAPATATGPVATQASEPSPAAVVAKDVALADLSWLSGCWRGNVNRREFREHWMPLRGNLIVGVGHTVMQDRTQGYEYIRIEPRDGGIDYVALPSGGKETAFRLVGRQVDGADTIFTFASTSNDFPQRVVYRRAAQGWLYVNVEGRVQGEERKVIYPMRRIDCESGEVIAN